MNEEEFKRFKFVNKFFSRLNTRALKCSENTKKLVSNTMSAILDLLKKNKSVCDGGNSMTCLNQMPQVVSISLAYAFTAAPGNGPNVCGKCFELKFDGRGKYETKGNL